MNNKKLLNPNTSHKKQIITYNLLNIWDRIMKTLTHHQNSTNLNIWSLHFKKLPRESFHNKHKYRIQWSILKLVSKWIILNLHKTNHPQWQILFYAKHPQIKPLLIGNKTNLLNLGSMNSRRDLMLSVCLQCQSEIFLKKINKWRMKNLIRDI